MFFVYQTEIIHGYFYWVWRLGEVITVHWCFVLMDSLSLERRGGSNKISWIISYVTKMTPQKNLENELCYYGYVLQRMYSNGE